MVKKRTILITALCALIAAPAMADLGDVTEISVLSTGWTYQTGSGGEFLGTITGADITLTNGSILRTGANFLTFCVERNEYVEVPSGNYYAVVNSAAVKGGLSGGYDGGNTLTTPLGQSTYGDPLSSATAYIFTLFAKELLTVAAAGADYRYDGTVAERKADAAQLQAAIWALEQEQAVPTSGKAKIWYDAAIEATTAGGDGVITWTGLGDVRVLNLYSSYNGTTVSGLKQDLLVHVPLPGAVLLGMLGLGAAGMRLRRKFV